MADINNFAEMNENFDTIKTLLNSIRAQGILNTSDVDKLLTGINSKLEKINTEEDIDLIKIFLSELKQNLDERHSVLVSKFGAIESLFSNLLKNSSEMPKSSELKELFDIVATNLSVFSREVVSQKESLTDITLRLDALRSDDSQKRDIIKNITLLKPDLERLNNGFDSIVISLNDNFKTVVKTISSMDKTESFDKFSEALASIEMSTNTVLSALQLISKKTEQVDESLRVLATKDDLMVTNRHLVEITAQNQEIASTVNDIQDRNYRLDGLADKIDASVSIIAGLKAVLEAGEDRTTKAVLEELKVLEVKLAEISSESKFEEIKVSLEELVGKVLSKTESLNTTQSLASTEIQKILLYVKSLDLDVNLKNILTAVSKTELELKNQLDATSQKLITLSDANISRVLNDISSNADVLNAKLNDAQSSLAIICEKNFSSVFSTISDLKNTVAQLDENTVSANNAIFSNITDRLTVFENSLRNSLEAQEKTVNFSSAQLVEQIENIKNISSVLDYKMDTSVVEAGNVKREFSNLKSTVESVLALDFVNVVKDLRVDLYASKQDIVNIVETVNSDLSERFTTDLYGKYELLISKLDSVSDEFDKTISTSLSALKNVLENISASIVDVISYVSEIKSSNTESFDGKLETLSNLVKENNLNYVESVRDIVDVIRVQVENNIKSIEEESVQNFDSVKRSISENAEDVKKELKYSYSKLLEIQDLYKEIKETINLNNIDSIDKFDGILASAGEIKLDFESKVSSLKSILLDKISEFKQEFTCENADKVGELKFAVENLYNKNSQETGALIKDLKESVKAMDSANAESRAVVLDKILDNFVTVKDLITELNEINANTSKQNFEGVVDNIDSSKRRLEELNKETVCIFEEKVSSLFAILESIKVEMQSLSEKSANDLAVKVDYLLDQLDVVKQTMEKVDENVDGDMEHQLSIIESNFESLVSQISILFDKADSSILIKLNDEFNDMSARVDVLISEKLESYKLKIENSFDSLHSKTLEQSNYIQERISDFNNVITSAWEKQSVDSINQIEQLSKQIKSMLDSNAEIVNSDCDDLKNKFKEISTNIDASNKELVGNLKSQIDDIVKYIDSVLALQCQEINEKCTGIQSQILEVSEITNSEISDVKTVLNLTSEVVASNKSSLEQLLQTSGSNSVVLDHIQELAQKQNDIIIDKSASIVDSVNNVSRSVSDVDSVVKSNNEELKSLNKLLLDSKALIEKLETAVPESISKIETTLSETAADELKAIDVYVNNLYQHFEENKDVILSCKNLIMDFLNNELSVMSKNIEKETDVVIAELIEQFDILKKSQADEIVALTTNIEDIVNAHVYNNIEDLKSYLDIKTDNSVVIGKLDNIKLEMESSIKDLLSNLNKMLDSTVFTSAMSDYRLANEILINSSIDNLNDKIEAFINENIQTIAGVLSENSKAVEEKLNLFDKKFIDTVVDKYEEIKVLSNKTGESFEDVKVSISEVLNDFNIVKDDISKQIDSLAETLKVSADKTNNEIKALTESFEGLKSQISSRSFDEAFQASINKQVAGLEDLIKEQLGYIEDINDLCLTNLPDVSELNTMMKHSLLESVNSFSEKLESLDLQSSIEEELKQFKAEIITQFINVFNQVSFVAEQEEILDYIQEKHDELITILSHIVTSAESVEVIKDNLYAVDTKIDSIKEELEVLNDKISAVISSDGDVDYIYSLQDLESDIANLRLVLNDMNEKSQGQEFSDLISSTNEIYTLVESLKADLPNKEAFEDMAENLVSISTRTNKLLLASDESNKNLQDNLQDFKLVINDLDERTRNFARESGIDRIDTKLNAINSMMLNGAKSNQIFNQVFEYLAEWVDKAGLQINAISDRVETLDEISQIKTMIADLKTESADNTETVELIEALGTVFDKQTKRISALETKLDRIIVDSTINKKIDISPMEETLNRFLVAIDEKMSAQQSKINSLEEKLQGVIELIDENATATLTKKVGGMDRQIAKLNKSIEKIASHVVEK